MTEWAINIGGIVLTSGVVQVILYKIIMHYLNKFKEKLEERNDEITLKENELKKFHEQLYNEFGIRLNNIEKSILRQEQSTNSVIEYNRKRDIKLKEIAERDIL